MILYKIKCDQGHEFDAWFQSSNSYYDQKDKNLVSCPYCGSMDVQKAVMAPNICKSDSLKGRDKGMQGVSVVEQQSTEDVLKIFKNTQSLKLVKEEESLGEQEKESKDQYKALKALQTVIKKSCQNVGKEFPEQVRKMHYGEIVKKNIYGQASTEDIVDLYQEGIDVIPLPFRSKEDA